MSVAWKRGMVIISADPMIPRTICYLCGSNGKHEVCITLHIYIVLYIRQMDTIVNQGTFQHNGGCGEKCKALVIKKTNQSQYRYNYFSKNKENFVFAVQRTYL